MVNRKMIKGHEIHLERMQDTLIHLKDSLCLSVFLLRERNNDDEKVFRRIFDIAFSRIGRVAIITTYQII